jgi:hypothetical protein
MFSPGTCWEGWTKLLTVVCWSTADKQRKSSQNCHVDFMLYSNSCFLVLFHFFYIIFSSFNLNQLSFSLALYLWKYWLCSYLKSSVNCLMREALCTVGLNLAKIKVLKYLIYHTSASLCLRLDVPIWPCDCDGTGVFRMPLHLKI